MPTTYNFTGQRLDSVTGLLYYNARCYDPFSARFTSADTVQSNASGMDPYAYVGDDPVGRTDPSGHDGSWWQTALTITAIAVVVAVIVVVAVVAAPVVIAAAATAAEVAATAVAADGAVVAGAAATSAVVATAAETEADSVVATAADTASTAVETATTDTAVTDASSETSPEACSFTPATSVATVHGEQPIGKLHIGEKVLAYNTTTHKMEYKPILHVWIHRDNDLVNLTITTKTAVQHGKANPTGSMQTSETVHTNKKHPFFTEEKGFLPVAQLKLGMHILRADGRIGIVTGWKVVPGSSLMYNLDVADDHTFTVGSGEWVVHNCDPQPTRSQMFNQAKRDAGIPTSDSPVRQGWVNRFRGELQRIYEFSVDGVNKYIIEHPDDPNQRGPHFHVADIKYVGQDLFQDGERYINLGKSIPGILAHYPEDFRGFVP